MYKEQKDKTSKRRNVINKITCKRILNPGFNQRNVNWNVEMVFSTYTLEDL